MTSFGLVVMVGFGGLQACQCGLCLELDWLEDAEISTDLTIAAAIVPISLSALRW